MTVVVQLNCFNLISLPVAMTVVVQLNCFNLIFPVAGPGPGFYSLFCVVTHLATLLFGALMTTIDSHVIPQRVERQKNVSISYGKDQGIIVNDNISDKDADASCEASDQRQEGLSK